MHNFNMILAVRNLTLHSFELMMKAQCPFMKVVTNLPLKTYLYSVLQ